MFAEPLSSKPKAMFNEEGNVVKPCDEDTAKLKAPGKRLPKGSFGLTIYWRNNMIFQIRQGGG